MTASSTTARPDEDRMLIALDVDGTLLGRDESVSQAVMSELTRVDALGHEVTLATGRSWETAHIVLDRLGLRPEFVVCANGAIVLRRDDAEQTGYRREFVETFDAGEVLRAIRPKLPRGSFMVEDATGFRRYTEGMSDWNLENAQLVDFDDLTGFPASRVVVVSPEKSQEEFLEVVDALGLHRVTYWIGWTSWLDLAPEGVNKATALEKVRALLGIPRTHVMAVGDGHNDIEMLRWAAEYGAGVAMGGSPDEVLAVANRVTDSVEQDGVARLLAAL